ncbi:MAG: Protein of unknown function (DUF3352) [Rhodobacteraceae bacterium HLUCCA12]|nr:MAG: Protein of unknown function (DUF3352) [Rhodobacteraceae bacterium HLUCCA12]
MIRAVFLVLGLTAGIAVAVASQFSMAHLRALAGDRLPGWTQIIPQNASLLTATAVPLPRAPHLTAQWRLAGVDGSGPVWRLTLSAPGLRLTGEMRAGNDRVLRIESLQGDLTPRELEIWTEPPAFSGVLGIERAQARLDLVTGVLSNLQAEGIARDVTLTDSNLGDGRFDARRERDGRWQVNVSLAEGQAEIEVAADALGGILRAHAHPDIAEQVLPAWGAPVPSGAERVMVSYLLPLPSADPG